MSLVIQKPTGANIKLANGQPVANDPYLYTNTVLLLHGDGANNSTTIIDSSRVAGSPKTVTAVGNAQISTTQSKFGGGALYFDGNGDAAVVTIQPGDVLGAGDFTIEYWLYAITPASAFVVFDSRSGDLDDNGFAFYVRATAKLAFGRGSPFVVTEGSTTVSANTWHHAALARQGSTVRGFLNGNQEFLVSDTKIFSRTSWVIGSQHNITGVLSAGYIDELRITKGIARYTANFTPPTAPFPDF